MIVICAVLMALLAWQRTGNCKIEGRQESGPIIYEMFTMSLKTISKDISKIL